MVLFDRRFRSFDGKELPFTRWGTTGERGAAPDAVVIAVHGLSGAASDFWRLGEGLPPHGMVVYAPELRGQGNDPEPAARGDVESRRVWVRDLWAFSRLVAKRHEGVPIVWYGESLGSLIALHAAVGPAVAEGASAPAGGAPDALVLASPVVGFREPLPKWQEWLFRLSARLQPMRRISLDDLAGGEGGEGGEASGRVTSDTTHEEQMKRTPHYVERFTLRLLLEVARLVVESGGAAERLTVPTLVLYTPNDVFTGQEQVEAFFERVGAPDREKILFDRSYHLILHDVQADEAVRRVREWVARTTGGADR